MVENMYEALWEYLVLHMKELKNTDLYIKNIGTFKLRYSQLDRFIKATFKAASAEAQRASMWEERKDYYLAKSASYYKDYENILVLKEKLNQQWLKSQEKKKQRNEYISRNLEEQGVDNGRDQEQTDKV